MANQPFLRLSLVAKSPGHPITSIDLARTIRSQITRGSYLAGCKMPPVRVLAHQLAVSKNTIQAAYNELVDQDVLESRPRVGLFVARQSRTAHAPQVASVPVPDLVEPLPERPHPRLGSPDKPGVFLSGVWIDPDLLPHDRIAACFRSVLNQPGLMTLYSEAGYAPLREILAKRLKSRGIHTDPRHIVITAGSQQGFDLVCRIVKQRRVAIESPAYGGARQMFDMNRMKPIGLPIDPFRGIDIERWRDAIKKHRPSLVTMTTNFQNPTGYSYSTAEVIEILKLSEAFNFGILEDDWGSDMMSFSEFRPSVRAQGGDGVFYLNSFTKKLLPSLRVGYIVGSEATTQLLLQSKRVSCLGLPTIVEAVLFEFLDRGYYDAHLKTVQAEMDRRYHLCLEGLRLSMPDEVKWTTPGGGPCLWLELPKRVRIERLQARMAERNVIFLLVNDCFLGRPHLNGFRIGYGLPKPEALARAIDILGEELRRML